MATKYLLLAGIITLTSCNNSYKEQDQKLHTIEVAKKLTSTDTSSFNNKFEFVRSIALKSPKEFPFVEVNKLYLHNGNFYVFDKKYSNLSAFDSTGNYLHSIGKIGEGEGEYLDLSDVVFDQKRKLFLLFSNGSHALYTFAPEGRLLKRVKIPFYASSMAILPGGDLAFYVNYNTSEANAMHNVLITDPSGSVKEKYFPYSNKNTPSFDITGYVAENTAGALVSPAFSDTIFQLSGASIAPKYVLNLDKFQFKEFENKDAMAIMQELGNHYFLKSGYLETDDWLAFTLVHRGRESKFFYQPTTNNTLYDAQFNPYSAIHYLKQPIAFEGEAFISHLFTDYFLYMEKDRQKILDQVQKEDKTLYNLLSACKEGDNPVLIFYSLKK